MEENQGSNNDNQDNSLILLPILKKIPLFASLDENDHREIISRIILMYYPKDYELFAEGEEGDTLYIVKNGAVEIYHKPEEEGDFPESVAQIGNNGFFGEMALVSEQPRNASAKVVINSEIFILNKSDFKELLNSNSHLAQQISETMIKRIKENQQSEED